MNIWTKFMAAAWAIIALPGCASGPADDSDQALRERVDAMYAEYRDEFEGIGEVSADEAAKLIDAGDVVVVDVREADERAVSFIPGSISQAEFDKRRDELSGKKVVAYCTIGYRSGMFTQELQEEGWDAYNLKGSMLSWVHAGQPVVDDAGEETTRVHVYGKKWDLLPEGFESVY